MYLNFCVWISLIDLVREPFIREEAYWKLTPHLPSPINFPSMEQTDFIFRNHYLDTASDYKAEVLGRLEDWLSLGFISHTPTGFTSYRLFKSFHLPPSAHEVAVANSGFLSRLMDAEEIDRAFYLASKGYNPVNSFVLPPLGGLCI